MVEPVYAWAAVAPDGEIDIDSIRQTRVGAQDFVDWVLEQSNRPEWRVIRVQISPAFDHKDPTP